MDIVAYIKAYVQELLHLTNEMSPYLLLGFLIAGFLHVYFPKSGISKHLGSRKLASIVKASIFGIPLPLCSCGVIPTGISFYKNGASKEATVSFLVSTPQTGVDSILITYSMLGLPFAILRPIFAFFSAIAGGLFTKTLTKKETSKDFAAGSIDEIQYNTVNEKFRAMLKYAFVDFLNDLSKWLIIGLMVAALISTLVPAEFFSTYLNQGFLSLFIVLLASVPMYVCATGSVPIAAVLLAKGLSPGAVLVFLMAGPATNMATILVIGKTLGRNTLIAYLTSIIVGALFFGILIDSWDVVSSFFMNFNLNDAMHHSFLPTWLQASFSITLFVLILNGYFYKKKKTKSMENQNVSEKSRSVIINVKGMTCSHCKNSVETNVTKLEGIDSVLADPESDKVEIRGENIDIKKVSTLINELGYEYVV